MPAIELEPWIQYKEQICIRLRLALSSFDTQNHFTIRYETIGKLIFRIQNTNNQDELKKILQLAITAISNDPACYFLQFILTAYLENDDSNGPVALDKPLKLLQASCFVSADMNNINLDFTPWLNADFTVNNRPLSEQWKKRASENKKSWFSSLQKVKQKKRTEFIRYLSSAGVKQYCHPFLFQALSTTGIRTIADLYLNGIQYRLHRDQIRYDHAAYHFHCLKIEMQGNKFIINQKLRFEIKLDNTQIDGVTVDISMTFETDGSALSPQPVSYEINHLVDKTNLPNNTFEIFNQTFRSTDNTKKIPQEPFDKSYINFSNYITHMERTGDLSTRVNQRYFLMTLPYSISPKLYYLVDTHDILGQGGYGKVFQAYQVSKEKPIANSASPKFAAKQIHNTLFDPKEMAYSLSHMTIHGVIQVNHDYTPYHEGHSCDEISLCIVLLEHIPGCTINKKKPNNLSLSLTERLRMVVQLVTQVQAFHDLSLKFTHRMVHCDLKLDNVMFYRDSKGRINVRVIDFGLANFMPEPICDLKNNCKTPTRPGKLMPHGHPDFIANPQYAAPEMIRKQCGVASDIFMLAPIIAIILGEKNIMGNKNKFERHTSTTINARSSIDEQIEYTHRISDYNTIFDTLNYDNPEIKKVCRHFLSRMSHPTAKKRPKIQEAVKFFIRIKNEVRQTKQPRQKIISTYGIHPAHICSHTCALVQ